MKRHTKTPAVIGLCLLALLACCRREEHRQAAVAPPSAAESRRSAGSGDGADTAVRAVSRHRPDVQVCVLKGQALRLETGGLSLSARGDAVLRGGTYTATALVEGELAPLPQGMVNMTACAAGYRLLPGGDHFSPAAELRVAYDPERLPAGYTPDDIHTSYYDSALSAWVRLERVGVDTARREVVSLTTHFTDFVNELLKAPEMPETQAFVPTSMSALEAAHPMEGLTLMQPPAASQDGSAALSYPFDLPAGRGGMQPSLALTYNSGGGSGWLGEGWDIPIPAVSVDTRWGVPRYDSGLESETYVYRGEQLVALDGQGDCLPLPHRTSTWHIRLPDGTRFRPRVDEAFDSIVRHGDSPADYWWEVYDRAGVVHRYGHYETRSNVTNQSTLRDSRGNIARWCLAESEDAYGNMVLYLYDTVQYSGVEGGIVKGVQIYPAEIRYTLHRDATGAVDDMGYHKVVFFREDDDHAREHSYKLLQGGDDPHQYIPPIISGRNGFKEVTASLLSYLRICSDSNFTNRIYYFGLKEDKTTNHRVVLKNVSADTPHTGMDYNSKGAFERGNLDGDWLNFDYVAAGDNIFGAEVSMDDEWDGQDYDSDAGTTGFVSNVLSLFDGKIRTTALDMSRGFNYSVGGGISAGFGFNVFWTELAAGGNYSYSHGDDRGVLTLIDLDGDGLSDKVFKDLQGRVKYRRHIRVDDQHFIYGPAKVLDGIGDFRQTTTHNHDVGLQVSLGISATGSRNWGKSYTNTYFSDVNADGLPDLVTDSGVYFNNLVNDIPTFQTAPGQTNPLIDDTIRTTSMPCGYVIYGGILNDSLYCPTVRYDKEVLYRSAAAMDSGMVVDFIDSGYFITWAGNLTVQGYRYRRDCEFRGYRTGGADGVGGWDIDPAMEAVKVWIAPFGGTITVTDTIRMQPDRTGGVARSRYVDGVAYKVQWNKGVQPSGTTRLSCTDEVSIPALSGELTAYDTVFVVHDTTFDVAQGDILFFRLQSGRSRLNDRVDWKHGIRYAGVLTGSDVYGKPISNYISSEDYVVAGNDFFQAPDNGLLVLDLNIKTGTLQSGTNHDNIKIRVQHNNNTYPDIIIPEYFDNVIPVYSPGSPQSAIFVQQGDSVKVSIKAYTYLHTTWGNVECRPRYRFIPTSHSNRVTDTLEWWVAPSIPDLEPAVNTVYGKLFGPLYRGWGQFSYMADGTSHGDKIHLSSLSCNKIASMESLNRDTMESIGNFFDPDDLDNLTFEDLSSAMTATGNYNPLSTDSASRWRRMEPDCRNQAWLGYGRTTALTRVMAANVCPQEFFATGEAAVIMDMDCPAPASTPRYPKVKTQARYSESRTDNLSAAVDIGVTLGGSHSTGTSNPLADFLDMNGDSYPDLVSEGGVQFTMPYGGLESNVRDIMGLPSETKTRSAGVSIAPGDNTQKPRPMFGRVSSGAMTESVPDRAMSANGSAVTGCDTAQTSLVDINGDGLPDKVYSNGNVALNVGYSFLSPEPWECRGAHGGSYITGSGTVTTKRAFNLGKYSISGGISVGMSDNSTEFQLMDINGDGMPDRVSRNTSGRLIISINMGGGKWEDVEENVAEISHGLSFNENLNAAVTLGKTVLVAKVTATVSGTPKGRSFSGERVQIMDVNGDGFPDHVTSDDESRMSVRYNTLGRVNLLVGVHNYNQASFVMDYSFTPPTYSQPHGQWVLSSCRVCGDPGKGVPDSYTTYSYRNPRYDRFERMSFGYDTVITCQHIQGSGGAYEPYRYVTEGYHNGSYQKRGKKRSESVSDVGGLRWDETLYDVTVVDLESGMPAGDADCPLVSYPVIEKTITNHYEGGTAPALTTAVSFFYDDRRNIVTYINWGDTNRTGDELRADIGYYTGLPRNLVSLRESVTVRGGRLLTAPVMRSSSFTYDGKGGLASRTDHIDATHNAVTDYLRDAYGNVTRLTLPENATGQRMWYAYTYDPVLHRLPVRIDDAYVRSSSATYSYRYGKPLTVTDAVGSVIRYTYDTLGRTTTVTAPNEQAAGAPYTWKAVYGGHMWAKTLHYDPQHPSDPIETVTLCDRWGRVVQVKKDLAVGGQPMMQVSGKTVYDALGRAVRQYDPTTENPGTPEVYNTASTAQRTATDYDILDRAVACTTYHNPANLVQTTAYSYISVSGEALFQTAVTDPMGRTTTSLSDAYGRTVSVTDALNGTTLFEYDPLGQLLESTDPEGFATTYDYDLLGRPTIRTHPDAGKTVTHYDPAGNVTSQENEAGDVISYTYDYLRPTARHYSRIPENNVKYTYNDYGQLSEIQDGTGVQTFAYDDMGNVSENVRTFGIPSSSFTYTFHMEYEHDSWGRMLEITYPDGEEVRYGYDCGGNLQSMSGSKGIYTYRYIYDIRYDVFGNRSRIVYGNQSHTEYSYDDLQRLVELTTSVPDVGGETEIQTLSYSIDNAGNITGVSNSALSFGTLGGSYNNYYTYDGLDRLTGSTQSFETGNTLAAVYSPSGRILSKQQSFTGQNAGYRYDGVMPHAPSRVLDIDRQTLHNLWWTRCGNLAQVDCHDIRSGDILSSRYLYWSEDNRLTNVIDEHVFNYYAYDHGGERVLKITGGNDMLDINADVTHCFATLDRVTLYASPYLVASGDGYTKHYYAGTERVCARIGDGGLDRKGDFMDDNQDVTERADELFGACILQMRERDLVGSSSPEIVSLPEIPPIAYELEIEPVAGQIQVQYEVNIDAFIDAMALYADEMQQGEPPYFYHGDHLGSASWITDELGVPVQHLQYLPFGEDFVNQRTAGYDERFTFTGKEKDSETGFSYFGARYLDHDLTTLWLSIDPMADKYPSISPYAYCAWNPLKLVDPNGKESDDNDDWVRKTGTNQYIWLDNVHNELNTPQGYVYIGPNENDILTDLGLHEQYPAQFKSVVGGTSKWRPSSVIGIIYANSKNESTARLYAHAISEKRTQNITFLNQEGRTFMGVNFYVIVNQFSISADGGIGGMTCLGALKINFADHYTSAPSQLLQFNGPEIKRTNTTTFEARCTVSSSEIIRHGVPSMANIIMSYCNSSSINRPMEFNWHL